MMPIYVFICTHDPLWHETDYLLPISKKDLMEISCQVCGFPAKRVEFVETADIKTPEDSKSNFVYYENKQGEVEFTGTPNQWHPKGFVRKEARNLHERLAIEKRIRKQDNERLEKQREQRDIQRHYSTAERHSELRQRIREGQMPITNPETGNKESVVLDERSKSIIKKGMEYTDKKKIKTIDSEFHFSANHDYKSNIRGNE